MPSASRTVGGAAVAARRHRVGRMPRAARTLLAVLGVGSIAVTAAAASPTGLHQSPVPNDVFAAGPGGLGRLDDMVLPDRYPGTSEAADPATDDLGITDVSPDAGTEVVEVPVDGPVDVVQLGDEALASFISGGLADNGIPAPTLRAYRAAAEVLGREQPACRIDWALLAGIGRVESNHGRFAGASVTAEGVSVPAILGVRLDGSLAGTMVIRDSDGGALDGDTAYDRAVGPMQFLPGTWQRWGSDGDRDGRSDPQDIDDAALAAARYLCSGTPGLDQSGPAAAAVRRYNNSTAYVNQVLGLAESYRTGGAPGLGDGGSADPYVDPFGDGGWGVVNPYLPAAPGWDLPPGTVVGGPSTTITPSRTPSPSTSPSVPSVSPTSPTTSPSSPTTSPTTSPATKPTRSPAGTPTTSPTTPTTSPTDAVESPTTPTTTPTEPTGTPTEPTGTPTDEPSTPTPTDTPSATDPSTTPAPTDPPSTPAPTDPPSTPAPTDPASTPVPTPTPTCTPVPSTEPDAPVVEPSTDPSLEPCPPPCDGPLTEPVTEPSEDTSGEPAPLPTCLPVEP